MNGNNIEQTTLKEKILTEKKHKKVNQFKMLLALLLSNLFIYLIVSPTKQEDVQILETGPQRGFTRIMIKGSSLVPLENKQQPISILNKEKHLVLSKAKLIKTIESTLEQSRFEIEVKNEEALILAKQDEFILIPQVELTNLQTKPIKHGEQHEIIF